MVQVLNTVLPIIIYTLLIVVLIILVVIALKILKMFDLINSVIEDIEEKLESVNRLLDTWADFSYGLNNITGFASNIVTRIISRKEEK